MAKQTLNAGIGSAQQVDLISTSTLNPGVIAYKFSRDELSKLWSNASTTGTEVLIGLQIEFKDVILDNGNFAGFSSGLAASLKVTRVYFNPTPTAKSSHFTRVEQVDFDLGSSKLVSVVRISKGIGAGSSVDPQWHGISNFNAPTLSAGERIFERLYSYNKNQGVDFVYFSIRQLQVLCNLYQDFVLSGCQYQMGHKLAQKAGKDGENFPKDCFSLKIEGLTPVGSTSRSGSNIETSTPGADLVLGHPCPPMWQMFTVVAAEALMAANQGRASINIDLIAAMRKSWGLNIVGVRRENTMINK